MIPAAAILPAAQMIYGGFQALKANSELKKLRNQDISYKATPETQTILGITRDNAMHGYTEAEKQAFLQTVAGNTAKSYRMGMARAGNSLSNAIGASNQIANNQAMNQFAANNANLQRQNQNIYFGQVGQEQNRANMNTQMEVNNNRMAQQAFGQAQNIGVENAFSGLQMGAMLADDNGWFDKKGATKPTTPTTPANNSLQYANDISMNPNKTQYGNQWQANPYEAQAPQMNSIWSPFFSGYTNEIINTPYIQPRGQQYGGYGNNNLTPYKY